MSDKEKAGAAGDAPAQEPTEQGAARAPAKEPKFTKTRLRRDCVALFGVTTSTFDGATFGLTGTYTVKEMAARIKEWQNTPVFPAEKKEGK